MADTIGEIIDKLTIANIRIWHLEDEKRLFQENPSLKTKEEAADFLKKISEGNRERNSLIDQINAGFRILFDRGTGKKSNFQLSSDDLIGTKKNKFYKTEDH